MKQQAATSSSTPSKPDPRLEPVTAMIEGTFTKWVRHRDDPVLIDLVKAGEIENKVQQSQPLTDAEQAAYEALLETSIGGEGCTRGTVLR
jgi:hypothetical protein